jgi:2-polyprenyl-3-methyl-5-hydroxy-6-metoxy-1,4-benzoquinol methylase
MKEKFEEMHEQGQGAWFDEGYEERQAIINMGFPWKDKKVIEIGCGEGHLAAMIAASGAKWVTGVDYVNEAIARAKEAYHLDNLTFWAESYREVGSKKYAYDVLVMQGLLEHLTHPWIEFQWMIDTFKPETILVSAPCFINLRGYIWVVLDTLFKAKMSLTDKHTLHPWEFMDFAKENKLYVSMTTCEKSWGNGPKMIEDYKKRLPLALRDGNVEYKGRLSDLFKFMEAHDNFFDWEGGAIGAVGIYKITKTPQEAP